MIVEGIKGLVLLWLSKEEAEEFTRFVFGNDYLTIQCSAEDFIGVWNVKYGDDLILKGNGRPSEDIPKMISVWRKHK